VEKSAEPFLFRNSQKSAAHSSRTFLRGGNPNPAVLKKEPRQSKTSANFCLRGGKKKGSGENEFPPRPLPFFYSVFSL